MRRWTVRARVGTALAACAMLAPGSAAAAERRSADGFESRSLSGWKQSAAATVSPQAGRTGGYGAQISARSGPGFLWWSPAQLVQGNSYASFRAYVQVVDAAPGESVDLITIKNSLGRHHFDLFVAGDTQRLKWDLYSGDSDETSFAVVPGRWYLIEVKLDLEGRWHNADVRIDGVHQGAITSDEGRSYTVRSLWLGTPNAKTSTKRYDDVALVVGKERLAYLGAPTS